MYVIAVTGGLGSGKSVACEYFRSRGATVISLDDVAHQMLAAGTPVYAAVVEQFGSAVLDPDGRVDRRALAHSAFADEDGTERLNAIMHPVILREISEGITSLRLMERPPRVVVLEVPLLVEAPAFACVADTVLAINAPEHLRLERAVARGMSEGDARRRISRQAADAERAALADTVISNPGSLDEFLGQLEAYWDEVAPRAS